MTTTSGGPPTPPITRTARVVVVFCLAGLLPGTAVGLTAARVTTPAPAGPHAPPAISIDFPTSAGVYLPNTTVDLIANQWLHTVQWTCDTTPSRWPDRQGKLTTTCHAPQQANATIYIGHDDGKIRSVDAHCRYPPGTPLCATLFGALAGTIFIGSADTRAQARTWATDNVDRDTTTVIHGVRFIISLDPHHLRVLPAE